MSRYMDYTAEQAAPAPCGPSPPDAGFGGLLISPEPAITERGALPELPGELVSGVVRRGGKLLVTGASKAGKSYLLIELAMAVATGGRWCGFNCAAGRVLYVNLEIQRPQFMHRVFRVAERMGADPGTVSANVDVANLRGKVTDVDELVRALVAQLGRGRYDLVVVDPAYKVQPGVENDADAITAFCAALDRLAEGMGCTVAYSHHHSKGAQGGKLAEDRGSGSGVFARDADALVDMTELEWDPDVQTYREVTRQFDAVPFRLEFVLRDFRRPEPRNIWFRHPVHEVDASGMLDDAKPRVPGASRDKRRDQARSALAEMERSLDEFMGSRDEVERKDFVAHVGKDARTVNKYVGQSALFDLDVGDSSATIRRKGGGDGA